MTANYILIDGHSNLVVTPDGGQSEDLNSATVYPLIRGAQSSSPVAALRNVDFKTALNGAALTRVDDASDAELLFDATSKEVRVAGGTALNGQTVSVVLRGSDGEGTAQAKARKDRLYTLQVRYLQALSAKAKVTVADGENPANGADYGINARDIRVATGTTAEQNVAYIDIVGGTDGYQLEIDTTKGDATSFELDGRTLQIKAGVIPGALPNGNELTAFVKVNDDENEVGGPETDALNIEVRVNYIALPLVAGSFVDTAGDVVNAVLDVYGKAGEGTLTIAATAKAEVSGNSGETYTFEEVGTSPLNINTNTGEITIPASVNPTGNGQDLIITVRFIGDAARSVPTTEILTVRYVGVSPIISDANSFQSRPNCHPDGQINGNRFFGDCDGGRRRGLGVGSQRPIAHTLRFPRIARVYNTDAPRLPIVRTMKTADGLN